MNSDGKAYHSLQTTTAKPTTLFKLRRQSLPLSSNYDGLTGMTTVVVERGNREGNSPPTWRINYLAKPRIRTKDIVFLTQMSTENTSSMCTKTVFTFDQFVAPPTFMFELVSLHGLAVSTKLIQCILSFRSNAPSRSCSGFTLVAVCDDSSISTKPGRPSK